MVKVKLFDCAHELDLEEEMNEFFEEKQHLKILQIEYQTQIEKINDEETIYSFSAMIVYHE